MGILSHFIAYRSVHKHLPFEQNPAQLPRLWGPEGNASSPASSTDAEELHTTPLIQAYQKRDHPPQL